MATGSLVFQALSASAGDSAEAEQLIAALSEVQRAWRVACEAVMDQGEQSRLLPGA
jgi:invasion protein IalB